MIVVDSATIRYGEYDIVWSVYLHAKLIESNSCKAYGSSSVVYDISKARQSLRSIGAHLCSIGIAYAFRMISDGDRILAEDQAILHAGCHIGRHVGGVTVVLEPRCDAVGTLVVVNHLISHANRTDGNTSLACHIHIVGIELIVIIGKVCPIATVSPVHRHNDNSIGVWTVFADVTYPLFYISTESFYVCTW